MLGISVKWYAPMLQFPWLNVCTSWNLLFFSHFLLRQKGETFLNTCTLIVWKRNYWAESDMSFSRGWICYFCKSLVNHILLHNTVLLFVSWQSLIGPYYTGSVQITQCLPQIVLNLNLNNMWQVTKPTNEQRKDCEERVVAKMGMDACSLNNVRQ